MREFRFLVWIDDTVPYTSEPVLVCYPDVNGKLEYCMAWFSEGVWREHRECIPVENVVAWAAVPRFDPKGEV